ncbi:MAG: histidinol dehydrogenase [Magnetococcales bacterium]|nr:histidinol dehydrogenase [Magnetococcales bacterium]MBF0632893.1 histidinol dehydrogenase [Magnetococcales bacterium]
MNPSPVRILDTRDPRFQHELDRLKQQDPGANADIETAVADILRQVRTEGDAALVRLTARFDRIQRTIAELRFSDQEIDQAVDQCDPEDLEALKLAARRIRDYHQWQMPAMGTHTFIDGDGTTLGQRLRPLERVGLYVPGGLASYPSSVLMNALPARVAGVRQLVMTFPTPDGRFNPLILAAARMAQVDEIYRIGGAQAIAAMAFGTATLQPVDKIVGPGNSYVATAKRQVFGHVGIDMIAGPSEILIIADGENRPEWLAADMLSQAEHDATAQSILITDQPDLAAQVVIALNQHLATLQRHELCRAALAHHGAIIIARSLEEACQIASHMAPEHLELAVANPERYLDAIDNAGAIFLGRYTPEPIGDYIAGPNHVLPTSRTARFSSPLGVHEFIKRSSIIGCTPQSLAAIGPAAARLAAAEGLTAHKLSIDSRLNVRP